jgi:hypothetical protein
VAGVGEAERIVAPPCQRWPSIEPQEKSGTIGPGPPPARRSFFRKNHPRVFRAAASAVSTSRADHACRERAADPLDRTRIDPEPLGDLTHAWRSRSRQSLPDALFQLRGDPRPADAFSLAPGPRQASTDSFLDHSSLELGKHADPDYRCEGGRYIPQRHWFHRVYGALIQGKRNDPNSYYTSRSRKA